MSNFDSGLDALGYHPRRDGHGKRYLTDPTWMTRNPDRAAPVPHRHSGPEFKLPGIETVWPEADFWAAVGRRMVEGAGEGARLGEMAQSVLTQAGVQVEDGRVISPGPFPAEAQMPQLELASVIHA